MRGRWLPRNYLMGRAQPGGDGRRGGGASRFAEGGNVIERHAPEPTRVVAAELVRGVERKEAVLLE